MTTRIIIARHGNTFAKGETPTRVGGKTDLALVESDRGHKVGEFLKRENLIPDVVFAAPLKRTTETAKLAIEALGIDKEVILDESFREIDYGPDENKTEDVVVKRLGEVYLAREGEDVSSLSYDIINLRGEKVIEDWNTKAIVPDGWKVDPDEMINTWLSWGKRAEAEYSGKNVLIVSSNGIIRFAPYLTGDFDAFSAVYDLKVGTGNICVFEKEEDDKDWTCVLWNHNPRK